MTDVFLEPRVLNYTGDKYELILLSLRWARALKAKGTPEALQSLVEKSLRDIVEGRLTRDEILAVKAPPIVEAPAEDLPTAVSVADDGSGPKALPPDDEEDEKKGKKNKKKKDD